MRSVYIIPGYGVPKDITRDFNMQLYLRAIFNQIYDAHCHGGNPPLIITTGGKTDMWPPYRRTEAVVMMGALRLFASRQAVAKQTARWTWKAEPLAISTLENAVFTKRLLQPTDRVTVFCEQTRAKRLRFLYRRVFGSLRFRLQPIDFDVSTNRYTPVSPALERKFQQLNAWALRSPRNLAEHHRFYAERLRFLRRYGATRHVEAVREWNKRAEEEFPDFVKRLQ